MAVSKIFGDLKICVTFTLKELRCELSTSFDIISDSEKGSILFLQIAVYWEEWEYKKTPGTWIFHKQEEKRLFNNLIIKLADRESS